MSKLIKKIKGKYLLIKGCFKKVDVKEQFIDIEEKEFWDIYDLCKPFTMTSIERMYALYQSVKYILDNAIPGSFVECGVWRGGSSMLVAKMLANRNLSREIYLFDTFEGMSEPTENDVTLKGFDADKLLEENKHEKENSVWCLANETDVQRNLEITGYDMSKIKMIKGKVEDTIPSNFNHVDISLLRLDTDWYESTKHELEHLYPLLVKNGVLIIDDYGHWKGCRKAVDEYFDKNNIKILFQRIDYTGRFAIKH